MLNDRIVRRIHEIFGAGLDLIERLEQRVYPSFESEHNKLLSLLVAGGELDHNEIYNGDLANAGGRHTLVDGALGDKYFGVRYALTCWIDEMCCRTDGSIPQEWASRWTDNTLEVRLYGGSNQRAWRFWQQAVKAQGGRGSPEALEAYLWAVMLGFRGEPGEQKVDPAVWCENVRRRVVDARKSPFPLPPDRDLVTDVPALTGSASLRTALRVLVSVVAVVLFLLSIVAVKYLPR